MSAGVVESKQIILDFLNFIFNKIHHPGMLSLCSSLPPLPDDLASLDIGMRHLSRRGVFLTRPKKLLIK